MKKIILALSLLVSPLAFANEQLHVLNAGEDTLMVLRMSNQEIWTLTVDSSCRDLTRLNGRDITGEYDVDPSELGAKILLPASMDECRIVSAEIGS